MKILNIPIEPIEERYSTQWDTWFRHEFDQARLDYFTIPGAKVSQQINTGAFLDVLNTNQFKAAQLINIIEYLRTYKDDELLILFFHDLWFPELTNIAYIREGLNLKNLRICGCLHAGSYDQYDFLHKMGMTPWATQMENTWFGKVVDSIFVATQFHKELLCNERNVPSHRVHVTGFPIYSDFVERDVLGFPPDRLPWIVFPHRLQSEKQPELFDRLTKEPGFEDWMFIKTKEVASSKNDYYKILNRATIAVSFALQETWGIAMQESVLCGAIPVCPNRLSYCEMYPNSFRYDGTYEDAVRLIRQIVNLSPICIQDRRIIRSLQMDISSKGRQAIPNMISIMQRMK